MDKIYILSSGRSGTTFITSLLRELATELNIEHQKKGSRIINIISNLPVNMDYINWIILKLFGRIKGDMPKSTADPLISLALFGYLKKNKIDGKIIHLVREPQAFVKSFMRWKTYSLSKIILHYIIPFWNPNPFLFDKEIGFFEWLKMSKFEIYSWIWNFKNSKYYQLSHCKKNYMLIRLEDLTCDNLETRFEVISRLVEFLEIKKDDVIIRNLDFRKKNKSKERKSKDYQNISEEQIIDKHCSELSRKLGYL